MRLLKLFNDYFCRITDPKLLQILAQYEVNDNYKFVILEEYNKCEVAR